MTDPNRKVSNPLFSNAVTGGTIEDFSQNALLLPAREKPPQPAAPILQPLPPAEEAINFFDSTPSTQPPFNVAYHQPSYPEVQQIDLNQPSSAQPSHLSSVFSSFSNILKLGSTSNPAQPPIESVPPPAGIETLISQPPTEVAPVPLFPSIGIEKTFQPPRVEAPLNSFRRTGPKRPVYAQVPGLSAATPTQPPVQFNPQPPVQFNPQPPVQFNPQPPVQFNPQPSPSSLLSEFTPTLGHIPLEVPQVVSAPFYSGVSPAVMAAMPANEVIQTGTDLGADLGATFNPDAPSTSLVNNQVYRPVYHHWFHRKEVEGKVIWQPFSMSDSLALDAAFTSNDVDPDKVVATDGGRFDVNILRRQRNPVYWKGTSSEVRRCSWFHKGNSDGRYAPYEENIATKLEEEFKSAFELNQWHRKVELANGETVVFHAPDVLVLFPPSQSPDAWGNTPVNQLRPRIVKRGMDEFDIDDGEPEKVDHLLFLVHGIGSVCDLKFRSVEEVVDEFRSISLQLVQSHYRSSCDRGIANRIEVLPVSWHEELHSEDTGIDQKLKSITLDSIPKLRDFTNDTLLDILFYTSPVYCQTIISTVGDQMNAIYDLFKQRNPDFQGGVSLGGHSLGSLILFDLLCHQHPEPERETPSGDEDVVTPLNDKPPPSQRRMSRRISYMMGSVGTGQPQIHYPNLTFQPKAFFALGSPIGMFVTVRGLNNLGEQFALPTCPAFFNIFHPYDPVAYRVESLVNPELSTLKPVLIPHHKGRKRMHLELKETMARVGADLKQRVVDSMKNTWNSFYQLAMFHRQDQASLEEEMDKAFKEQLRTQEELQSEEPEEELTDLSLGILNKNRRIDYVLQEAPFEFFNEYIFALTSHVCYWESEDTMLLILKEIYTGMNISTDNKIPQQTMTIERPPPSPKSERAIQEGFGIDPTMPPQQKLNLGPPPIQGFVKKT